MCKMGDGDIVLLDLASSAVSFHPLPSFYGLRLHIEAQGGFSATLDHEFVLNGTLSLFVKRS